MTFEIATSLDIPALSALWRESFGDSDAEQRCFWESIGRQTQVFCARDERIASMLCALPAEYLADDGSTLPVAYLYAVCTRADARGQGLGTKLLEFAETTLRAQGAAACVLVPASESLARFYEARGYQATFFVQKSVVNAQKGGAKLRRIDAAAYRNLREMQLFSDFASFSEDFLRCAEGYGRLSGAGLYRIETSNDICCAAAGFQDGALQIYELIPPVPQAAAALAAALGTDRVEFSAPGGIVPQAWAKPLSDAHIGGYWGLSL